MPFMSLVWRFIYAHFAIALPFVARWKEMRAQRAAKHINRQTLLEIIST